jgi:predicted nuclease of predicted toxin-antitoxin system
MELAEFSFLADENIQPAVIAFLREQGLDVFSFPEQENFGLSDAAILRFAVEENRIVLTHDSDFGGLVILNEQSFVGIVYLRPGHIQAEFTIETIRTLFEKVKDVQVPFIIVAERSGENVRIRLRQF